MFDHTMPLMVEITSLHLIAVAFAPVFFAVRQVEMRIQIMKGMLPTVLLLMGMVMRVQILKGMLPTVLLGPRVPLERQVVSDL